jgi:hypothetical protein
MRYLLYLVRAGDGTVLMLIDEGQPLPQGEAQLVRAFVSRAQALEAMAALEQEFVFSTPRCVARGAAAEAR